MKAQTKTVVSLAVVCALAITAISGATYAWLSDSENSEVHVNTGKVNVGMDVKENSLRLWSLDTERTDDGKFENGGTAAIKTEGSKTYVDITNATPGDKVQFTLTLKNSSTIAIKWILKDIMDSEISDVFKCNIVTEGVQFDKWYDVTDVPTEEVTLKEVTIEISIPTDVTKTVEGTKKVSIQLDAYQYNYDDTIYYVNTPAELLSVAGKLADPEQQKVYNGKTITIMKDLDMSECDWPNIALNSVGLTITGVNDNIKISNLTIECKGSYNGFIASIQGNATVNIKNLTFSNATVKSSGECNNGVVVGMISIPDEARMYVTSCNVESSTISGKSCGAIVGYSTGYLIVEGCTVSNTKIGGDGCEVAGGIIGSTSMENGGTDITSCRVTDCTISATNAGCILGEGGIANTIIKTGCLKENNTTDGTSPLDNWFSKKGTGIIRTPDISSA